MKEEFTKTKETGTEVDRSEPPKGDDGNRGRPFDKIEVPEYQRLPFRFDRFLIEEFSDLDVSFMIERGDSGPLKNISLRDISSTGLSFIVAEAEGWVPGQVLSRLKLSFEGWDVYDGPAVVRSVRTSPSGDTLIGLSFKDSLVNVEEIVRLKEVKTACQRHEETAGSQILSWFLPGHHEYKARLAEFMLFLDAHRKEMQQLEKELGWEEIHGNTPNLAREILFREIEQGFVKQWNRWLVEINESYISDQGHASRQMESLTQRLLHPYVLEAPFMHRAFFKPLGYPGDYVLMTYIYSRNYEGNTLFGKAVHRGAIHTAGAEAVRGRQRLLSDRMSRAYRRDPSIQIPFRIASIASGPAQELADFLEHEEIRRPIEILLFEQDKNALAYSNRKLKDIVARRNLENVQLFSLRDTIVNLFKDERLLVQWGPYDFIYASGLFDYLKAQPAAVLTSRLWLLLVAGGSLYIGNFSHGNTTRWGMEGMASWYLIHRTPEEVLGFSSMCEGAAIREVITEATEVNLFLHMEKA